MTEDASEPLGGFYRFVPLRRHGGKGSLHAGGALAAVPVLGVKNDLSVVQELGTVLRVSWLPVRTVNPGAGETPVREQVQAAGATPI